MTVVAVAVPVFVTVSAFAMAMAMAVPVSFAVVVFVSVMAVMAVVVVVETATAVVWRAGARMGARMGVGGVALAIIARARLGIVVHLLWCVGWLWGLRSEKGSLRWIDVGGCGCQDSGQEAPSQLRPDRMAHDSS